MTKRTVALPSGDTFHQLGDKLPNLDCQLEYAKRNTIQKRQTKESKSQCTK
jgi:hypothetical protein